MYTLHFFFLLFVLLSKENEPFIITITISFVVILFIFLIWMGIRSLNKKENILKNGIPAMGILTDSVNKRVGDSHGHIYFDQTYLFKPKDAPEFTIKMERKYDETTPPSVGEIIYIKYLPGNKIQYEIITKDEFVVAGGILPSDSVQAKF
jgi:hypothetical protein